MLTGTHLLCTQKFGVRFPEAPPIGYSTMSEKSKYFYRYRSAVTGEYVTEEYAKVNPDTTVREREKREKDE